MYILGSESADVEGKQFVREVGDRSFSYGDFRVAVYHKRQWKWTQWKDIGKRMSVPMVATSPTLEQKPDDSVLGVLQWYQGFDETSGEKYSYLYRANEGAIESINTLFGSDMEVEDRNGIDVIRGVNNVNSVKSVKSLLSGLFVLHLLWGKWEQRDGVLHGIKVAIPLISSTMQYQETIQQMVAGLREMDIMIKMDELETEEGIVIQLASRDVCLMEQFALWYKPLATREVISTKDLTQSLVSSLEEFLGEEVSLSADQMIKIGSVQ